MPKDFVKDGALDTTAFAASYNDLAAFKAQQEERLQAIPQKPEDYQITAPADMTFGDLELPEGFAFEMSNDERAKPIIGEFQGFLHKHQLPPAAANDLMSMFARYQAIEVSDAYKAVKQEMAALGPQAQSRVASLSRALESKLPKDLADGLRPLVQTAAGVRALEALLKPSAFTPGPAQPSTPDTSGMTAAQKLALANQQSRTG